jgi:hypothetical protein
MKVEIVNIHHKPTEPYIYCGRGSPVGNPHIMRINTRTERALVCDACAVTFAKWVESGKPKVMGHLRDIWRKGRTQQNVVRLGCYCAPHRCHCETIKQFIEKQPSAETI